MLCDACCVKLSDVAWSVPLFRLLSHKFLIAPPVNNYVFVVHCHNHITAHLRDACTF